MQLRLREDLRGGRILPTVSINGCFDKFLILAKRGTLFGVTKKLIKKQEKCKKHKRTKVSSWGRAVQTSTCILGVFYDVKDTSAY